MQGTQQIGLHTNFSGNMTFFVQNSQQIGLRGQYTVPTQPQGATYLDYVIALLNQEGAASSYLDQTDIRSREAIARSTSIIESSSQGTIIIEIKDWKTV